MKKTFVLMLSLLLCSGALAQDKGVNFENLTFDQALAKAKANKKGPKLVFLDSYTEWCGPCKYMTNTVFPQEEAGKFFNANFVNIKIDMEKGEGLELAKRFSVAAYPTFLILDGDGKEVGRLVGSSETAAQFIERAKKAIDPANSPDVLKAAYDSSKSLDDAIKYLEALSAAYKNNEIRTFVNDNFDSFNDREKFSDKLWPYVSQTLSMKDSRTLPYVLENKGRANAVLGKEKVDKALIIVYKNMLMSYLIGKSEMTKTESAQACNNLSLLMDNDAVAERYISITRLYNDGKMEEIAKMFNASSLFYSFNEMDRQQIERVFTGMKGFPEETVKKYYEEKADMYKRMAEASSNRK